MICKHCGIPIIETIGNFVHTPEVGLYYIFCRCQCTECKGDKSMPCCSGNFAQPVEQIA